MTLTVKCFDMIKSCIYIVSHLRQRLIRCKTDSWKSSSTSLMTQKATSYFLSTNRTNRILN